jgi:hypothetical protein
VEATAVPESGAASRWWRPSWRLSTALVVTVLMLPVVRSYAGYLTAPGSEGWTVRSVEWIRDHGGSRLVDATERAWYGHHKPPVGGIPHRGPLAPRPATAGSSQGTSPLAAVAPATHPVIANPRLPANVVPLARPSLDGEGVWHPVSLANNGVASVYATYLRPDPIHTSITTGVAWMDTSLLSMQMYAGAREPGGGPWRHQALVEPENRDRLVAAFNSGFRVRQSRGGYLAEGRTLAPLMNGAASLVIDDTGRATVGEWGRDVGIGPHVSAVRQNLALIVDGGVPVAGLEENVRARWGWTLGNGVFVWRSGVGVDARGGIIYAGGSGLSAVSLARILAAAGAVRAMELDINAPWVSYYVYRPLVPGATAKDPPGAPEKLLADMRHGPNRYLEPCERDFFALFQR